MTANERMGSNAPGFMLFGAKIEMGIGQVVQKDQREEPADEEETVPPPKPEKRITEAKPSPCPRCKSNETKFCYFNNYNVNQPRHFCRGCQRYWTAGGTLRNVPVRAHRRKARLPSRIKKCILEYSPAVDQWFLQNHELPAKSPKNKPTT